MDLGAHVSAAGGIDKAVDRATAIGAETIQVFASSPRGWAFKPIPDEKVEMFRQKAETAGIRSTFLHGSYLVNIGGAPVWTDTGDAPFLLMGWGSPYFVCLLDRISE